MWERHALAELRHGSVEAALAAFEEAGRIHSATNARSTKELLVESWCDAHTCGRDARMYASRRADVDELNGLARSELRRRGALGGDICEIGGGIGLALGDEVLCLRNDRSAGVVNGTRGTVMDAYNGSLVIATSKGTRLLGPDYLDAGHLTHGYAVTVHKSQGATVDRAFIYANDSLFRESGYVAMSRARERTDLYVVTGSMEKDFESSHARPGPAAELGVALSRSRAKSTAMSEMDRPPGDSPIEVDDALRVHTPVLPRDPPTIGDRMNRRTSQMSTGAVGNAISPRHDPPAGDAERR